ncbi:MAG: outer membrane beta-barrel protein [Bacteroidota bacterium]
MKNILISAAVLGAMLFGNETQAQEITYGVKAGYSFANVRAPKRLDIYDVRQIGTYNFSAYIDLPFSEGFSLQTGLSINGKGTKLTVGDREGKTWTEYNSNPYYLELPANAVAKIAIGDIFDKCNVILGGGPYVAMGVSGKNKINGKTLGVAYDSEDNIMFSNDDQAVNSRNFYGEFKNFDFGLNALAGIEYHWATFNLNYSYGMVNVNPGANLSAIDRMKNRTWSASIGVRF